MEIRLTWKSQVICILISLSIVASLWNTSNIIISRFLIKDFILFPTQNLFINFNIYVLVLMIPITIIHELIHGLTYILFGGKIKVGFKGIYAYTQEISEKAIERTKFEIILLSPMVIISALTLLLPAWMGGMVFLLNLLGCSGDLYMTLLLIRQPYQCKVIDRSYGFYVIR